MTVPWKHQLALAASGFLDEHWYEEWPVDDWEQDLSEFTEALEGALADCWVEFHRRKFADLTAAVMDRGRDDLP